MTFFQFSLWDSICGPAHKDSGCETAFNSLYEILWHEQVDRVHDIPTFNSLYEIHRRLSTSRTWKSTFNSLYEIHEKTFKWWCYFNFNLSILFMRFIKMPCWKKKKKSKTFNSLYEILEALVPRCFYTKLSFQFSLWDSAWILTYTEENVNFFQFSLWDSPWMKGGGRMSDGFQFSLWDSLLSFGSGERPIKSFQFSLWDSSIRRSWSSLRQIAPFNSLYEILGCLCV